MSANVNVNRSKHMSPYVTTQVLVAAEDQSSVKLIAYLLEDAGYHVWKATDQQSALRLIDRRQPRLVLLDLGRSRASSLDICRQIRSISAVPLLLIAASPRLRECVAGLQLGANDFLLKPFDPNDLLARVYALLHPRKDDVAEPVMHPPQDGMTLDPIEHRVIFASGRSVGLTHMEFRLLFYLMQHVGQTLSTDQILRYLWGDQSEGPNNTAAVYIRRLRAKIEPDNIKPRRIITVRNIGYRFEP